MRVQEEVKTADCGSLRRRGLGGEPGMKRWHRFALSAVGASVLLMLLGSATVAAAPTDEAKAMIARWTERYNAGDAEGLVKLDTPDAVLLGTRSPIISQGTDAGPCILLRAGEAHYRQQGSV